METTRVILSFPIPDLFTLAFWLIAGITVLLALGVIFFKNIVHSALCLIGTFLGVAAVYLTLEADYLGLVQVLVYGGAVSVLIVFAIMLVQRGSIRETNLFGRLKYKAFLIALVVFLLLSHLLWRGNWPQTDAAGAVENSAEGLAGLMLNDFVMSFEIAAVLLLVAMIGAIVVSREVKK